MLIPEDFQDAYGKHTHTHTRCGFKLAVADSGCLMARGEKIKKAPAHREGTSRIQEGTPYLRLFLTRGHLGLRVSRPV